MLVTVLILKFWKIRIAKNLSSNLNTPVIWGNSKLKTLWKGKGSKSDPSKYRGLSIRSPLLFNMGGRWGGGGLKRQPNFQKGQAWEDLKFQSRLLGEGMAFFTGGREGRGCNFYKTNKLKSEIFNDKKSL